MNYEVFAFQLSWASDMRESLRTGDTPKDINSAKHLIQEHEEKWEDIQTHNDRYSWSSYFFASLWTI